MYDFSKELNAFWDKKVRLSGSFKDKLYCHRDINRDRLISRLPEIIEGISISQSSFKPQGSMAMKTIIQTRFDNEEYDIDDGLVLNKEDLKLKYFYRTADSVRNDVLEALKDDRFVKQPKLCNNCVRVFYSEDDKERHHVDFPIYRKSDDGVNVVQELASKDGWIESNPTQVNKWFEDEIVKRNKSSEGMGTQLRVLIQLLKRFCRSRKDWDMPNGMKLTMLAVECQKKNFERIDMAFNNLLEEINKRLSESKAVYNLAHPDFPMITKTTNDDNMVFLSEKIDEALDKIEELESCNYTQAKSVWNWIFKSDGFFDEFEDNSPKGNIGFADKKPSKPVDHRGGGKFGE